MKYYDAESKWTRTKPIRGRDTDVRPIGERRRTHERIEREAIDEGLYAYHAVLYDTRVITWMPNGDIIVRTGGWQSPTTAEFIHQYSPFICYKKFNKVWVTMRETQEHPAIAHRAYPVGDELRLTSLGNGLYKPVTPIMLKKQVVNREKAKEARAPLQPFLAWAKTILQLSDGWVMHETRKATLGWETYDENHGRLSNGMHMPLNTRDDKVLYGMLTGQAEIEPEDIYLRVLCCLAPSLSYENRLAEHHTFESTWMDSTRMLTQTFEDYRVDYAAVKRRAYEWVAKYEPVHDIVPVEAGHFPTRGTL